MDEQVERAIARWPNVPAVFGWLRLDRRGRWRLVDRGMPGFDEARDGAGSPITNEQIVDFIDRNYEGDPDGRWYWQNGPQRVYADLELAPLILRVLGSGADARLVAHTGAAIGRVDAAWRNPGGELILVTDLGPGAVHDLDLAALALEAADAGGEALTLRIHGNSLEVAPPQRRPEGANFDPRPREAEAAPDANG